MGILAEWNLRIAVNLGEYNDTYKMYSILLPDRNLVQKWFAKHWTEEERCKGGIEQRMRPRPQNQ